jgi:hypothetical protein
LYPERAIFQHRVDRWLRSKPDLLQRGTNAPDLDTLALAGNGPDYGGLFRAMLDRLCWFDEKSALLPDRTKWTMILSVRFAELVPLVPALDRETLVRLIQADTKDALYCGGPGQAILDRLEQYLKVHEFDLGLLETAEAWHKSRYGTNTKQTLRRHLGWLLWRESVRPVDLKSCWSARVRQDLREMPAVHARLWREFFSKMTFQISAKPPVKWKKGVAPVLKSLGPDEFAGRVHGWFKPFGEEKPLPLEATGADVLRCLLWAAAEVKDPGVDQALGWFPNAPWKTKKSKSYTNKLIGPYVLALAGRPPRLAHACLEILVERGDIPGDPRNRHFAAYRALCEQLGRPCGNGIAPPPPPTGEDFLAKSLKRAGSQITEESVTVQGQIETYVIDRKTREIRRQRDNAVVRFDHSSGPQGQLIDQMLNSLGPIVSQRLPEQARELARILPLVHLLKMDRHFSKLIRVSPAEPALQ